MAKLNGLKINEIISIGTKSKLNIIDIPDGINISKKCHLFFSIEIIWIPIKIIKLIDNVKNNELVIVKL